MARTMTAVKKTLAVGLAILFTLAITACAPKVGSPEWCAQMKDKAKGDWTTNEAIEFTKNCLI